MPPLTRVGRAGGPGLGGGTSSWADAGISRLGRCAGRELEREADGVQGDWIADLESVLMGSPAGEVMAPDQHRTE